MPLPGTPRPIRPTARPAASRAPEELGHRLRSPVGAHRVDDARVEAFARGRRERQHLGRSSAAAMWSGNPSTTMTRCAGCWTRRTVASVTIPESALTPDHQPGDLEPVLRKESLERISRHLPREPAEFGAEDGEVVLHDAAQCGDGLELADRLKLADAPCREHGTCAGHALQRLHVVGGASVGEGARSAGVVADHPADRAARARRRVGAEAQAEGLSRGLQRRLHDSRLDHRRTRLRIDRDDPVEVPAQVQHDPLTDRVAGHRRAATASDHRHAGRAGRGHRCRDLRGVAREGHHERVDAVERGVGGVGGARRRVVGDVQHPGRPQRGGDGAGGVSAHALRGHRKRADRSTGGATQLEPRADEAELVELARRDAPCRPPP